MPIRLSRSPASEQELAKPLANLVWPEDRLYGLFAKRVPGPALFGREFGALAVGRRLLLRIGAGRRKRASWWRSRSGG